MINKILWLGLDQETREFIANDFGMVKTEGSVVANNRVVSDGYSNESLMRITEEGLDEKLLKTQKTLPQGFIKKWEYYVSDVKELLGKEKIQYTNDGVLNESIEEQINEPVKEPVLKVIRTEEEMKNILKAINPEPKKKGGRPKGSKTKVVNKKKK